MYTWGHTSDTQADAARKLFGGQALAGALATLVHRCMLQRFHNCKVHSNLQNVRPAQLLQTM